MDAPARGGGEASVPQVTRNYREIFFDRERVPHTQHFVGRGRTRYTPKLRPDNFSRTFASTPLLATMT